MIEQLLESIEKRLVEINEINHADENWGQLNIPKPPVMFPCALIDVSSIRYEDLKGNDQSAEGMIYIHVATKKLSNTSFKAPTKQKEDAWKIYKLLDLVKGKLHNWRPIEGKSGNMIRREMRSVTSANGIQEKILAFELAFLDE